MPEPNVRVSVEGGVVQVDVLASGILVEVRDYDVEGVDPETVELRSDERGDKCVRYFVSRDEGGSKPSPAGEDLERFAANSCRNAGALAAMHPDLNPNGLHVLQINQLGCYFLAGGSGYDGRGKRTDEPGRSP